MDINELITIVKNKLLNQINKIKMSKLLSHILKSNDKRKKLL